MMAHPQPHTGADRPTPDLEARRRLRGRNVAIGLVLAAWVVLIYVVSLVKMGGA